MTDPWTSPSTSSAPPPGWYPDPWDRRRVRWWYGTEWSGHVAEPEGSGDGASGPAEAALGRWGLGDVGITVVLIIGFSVLAAVPLVLSEMSSWGTTAAAWALVVGLVGPWLGMAGWPLLAARLKGPGWRTAYGFEASWRALGWGLLGGVAGFVAIVVGVWVVELFDHRTVSAAAADLVSGIADAPVAFTVALLAVAVGAPFVEELAFRGLLWGAITKRGNPAWVATLVSGLAFGLIHFEPARFLGITAAGVVFGVVRQRGGLGASMLSHACINSLGALTLLVDALH